MLRAILFPVMLLILLLGIAALAVVLYMRYYTRHINRALKDEDAVIEPAPAPRAAGNIVSVLLICVGLWIVGLSFINKLTEINNSILAIQGHMSDQLSRLEDTLAAQLQQQNSLFLSFEYEATELDAENQNVTLSFRAIPKQATPDTTVTLSYRGRTLSLVRDGSGFYSGTMTQNLFLEPAYDGTLCLTENGTARYESVWIEPDIQSLFPFVKFILEDQEVRLKAKDYVLSIQGRPAVYASEPEKIRSMHLLFLQKGEILTDLDLTAAMRAETPGELLRGEYSSLSPVSLVLRWEDCYGLIHEAEQYSFAATSTGDDITYQEQPGEWENIYDAAGHFLGELR